MNREGNRREWAICFGGLIFGMLLQAAALAAEDRQQWQQPDRVMQDLGFKAEARVADIGCGGGYFTFRMAQVVGPKGKVFAVDMSEKALAPISRRIEREQLANVEVVVSAPQDTKLAAESIDAALLCNVLHDVGQSDRLPLLQSVVKALRPGGMLFLVDFARGRGVKAHPEEKLMSREDQLRLPVEAGLVLDAEFLYLKQQVFLRFRKPIADAAPPEKPAATPVDIYQDMQSGTDGNLLTPALMNASSHGGESTWSLTGSLWVSNRSTRDLPGPVIVGGKTYPGTGGARTWMFNDENAKNFVSCTLAGSYPKITVACYYTPGVTIRFWNQFDTIIMSGNLGYAVMQTTKEDDKGPYLRAHSCTAGWKTTFSPGHIPVVSGKTYWVNLHFNGVAGKTSVAVFDPEKAFAQVGETVVGESVPNSAMKGKIQFGRADNHGNNPTAKTPSHFQHIMIDYTNGAFPLIPRAAEGSGAAAAK